MAVKSFEELAECRRKCIEGLRANEGFEAGIQGLLTGLYPDKAHFLYELLQNAEDAGARQVEFRLESDALIFVHDGKKLFTLEDVDSITNIGNSTKRDDCGSIGKFGIGFKAVFGYTSTPIVHSGEFHFKILDLLVPERTDEDIHHRFATPEKTFFKFPFNEPSKPADKAYREIQEGLSSLPSEAMLFLRNIKEIYISFYGKESYVTKTIEGPMVVLRRLGEAGETKEVRYLRYEKTVDHFRCEDGKCIDQMTLGIAYKLQLKDGLQKPTEGCLSESYKIAPVTQRNVFVFFPAEKETSGLRFCLQAPFATNASRDSVCNTTDNARIVELLIDLQTESLQDLQDEGFLTTEFLGILPNSHDEVGEMYAGFHTRLIQLFQETALTPTQTGGYAPANALYRATDMLNKIISNKDLSILRGSNVHWVKNASQRNSAEDKFIDDLKIEGYGVVELAEDLARIGVPQTKAIFAKKTAGQLALLYEQFGDYLEECGIGERQQMVRRLIGLPLILLTGGTMACPSAEVFWGASSGVRKYGRKIQFVDRELYGPPRSDRQKRTILAFFKLLGIEEYNEVAGLKAFVEQYWRDKKELSDNDCVNYLTRLVNFVSEHQIDVNVAKEFPIRNRQGQYVKIAQTYIDDPYVHTGLHCFESAFRVCQVYALNEVYANQLATGVLKAFRAHLEDFGVHQRLWVERSPLYKNPAYYTLCTCSCRASHYKEEQDYDIPGLKRICEEIDEMRARFIWELLISVDACQLEASYKANRTDSGRKAPARWIATLTGAPWIVCRDGKCRKPCDVILDDLPDGWSRPAYEHPALRAIQFGEATKTRRETEERERALFRQWGFGGNPKEAKEWIAFLKEAKASGKTVEQFRAVLLKSSRVEAEGKRADPSVAQGLPRRSATNVQSRMESIRKSFESAPEQKYANADRSVRIGDSKIRSKARTYLRGEYADTASHEIFCQLCKKSTPFIARDGSGYFEATQVFTRMHKNMAEQFVALCPVCRAKYDEWVRRSRKRAEAFKNAILNHQVRQGEDFVHIDLPGDRENDVKSPLAGKSMYFTGTHFLDLQQAVLENERFGGSVVDEADEMDGADSNEAMPFVEWLLKYDAESNEVLQKVTYAYEKLDRCRQEGRRGSIVMWEKCASGHVERVMSYWTDYHASFPTGESQPVARASVERYCRQRMQPPQ